MALNKYRLGDLLELLEHTNQNLRYSAEDVRGVNNLKQLMTTKADLNGRDLSKFQIVNPGEFVFNHRTSRNGEKFSIAYNDLGKTVICTEDYVVFRVKPGYEKVLSAYWLYMYFNRPEFDRYVITNSWGSSTEFYNWEDLCSIELKLPDYETQQQYVNIYRSMVANQQSYERGLEDLKLVCDGYIEDLRRAMPCERIGTYILESNERNSDLRNNNVQGVNSSSNFGETKANTVDLGLQNYKIVRTKQFAYNPSRINLGSIALLNSTDCIVSPMYIVFRIVDEKKLLPEYLMLWLGRKEFQRSTFFYATGSVRDIFSFDLLRDIEIPIPNIETQKAIADLYNVYIARRSINEQLKAQIKDICPMLIRGSLKEGK